METCEATGLRLPRDAPYNSFCSCHRGGIPACIRISEPSL